MELCQAVAGAVQAREGLGAATVVWVPVEAAERFRAVREGRVDLLCGSDAETLSRRAEVSFSTPIFPGGIGALLRTDGTSRLQEVLSGRTPPTQPNWRASATQFLQVQRFAVVRGTTAESWLAGKLREFRITSRVVPVERYEEGIQAVADRRAEVFFGDRAILLDAAQRHPSASRLKVLERLFTAEPEALVLARGDDDFRLLVDRTLGGLYADGRLTTMFGKWFGLPSENVMTFLRWTSLPE